VLPDFSRTTKPFATSVGIFNVSIYANSSDDTNDTLASGLFSVYNEFGVRCPEVASNSTDDVQDQVCYVNTTVGGNYDNSSKEALIQPNQEMTAAWSCNASDYKIAILTAYWEANGTEAKARVYAYNGSWVDILHSQSINNTIKTREIAILRNQMVANESQYCRIKIE